MTNIQIVKDGAVIDMFIAPDGASIDKTNSKATSGDWSYTAADGCTLYADADAQIGWVVTDGAFSAPSAAAVSSDDLAASIRLTRDDLLRACDWTQVSDSPVDKTAWATYRQSLRDLPSQSGFPSIVTWPTQP